MGPVTEVHIRGQAQLERAFLELRRDVLSGLKPVLVEMGKVVAETAHSRAQSEISNIGGPWSTFRIGATIKGVYVAPKRRRRGGSPRPNLGGLLLTVMEESADDHRDELWAKLNLLVDSSMASAGLL